MTVAELEEESYVTDPETCPAGPERDTVLLFTVETFSASVKVTVTTLFNATFVELHAGLMLTTVGAVVSPCVPGGPPESRISEQPEKQTQTLSAAIAARIYVGERCG